MIGVIEKSEGLLDGTYRIALLTHEKPQIDALQGKTVEISIKEKKARRSLDANGYYWQLEGQLAESLRVSKPFLHNQLLRRYGQKEIIEDKPVYVVLPETDEVQRKVDEDTILHLYPTSQLKQGKDERMYRTYLLLRGSHEYNTAEMSRLIDGLVSECKEVGIETATPDEIARMIKMYGERYERKNKST